ncbi:MAG: sensor histidine kinase [Phocaeicola sp.]|uniref:sensor histidine kinase n=1 Tax=Phocaeicola sp. TaxID=2773926 RepID=UPI003FA10AA9
MAFDWLRTTVTRTILLMVGCIVLGIGIGSWNIYFMSIGGAFCVIYLILTILSRNALKEKCDLMLEAINNNDYTFRLPTMGFDSGEKALQRTLNRFGVLMGEQKQNQIQQEKYYEQILSTVTTGVIVLDDENRIIQTNAAAVQLLDLPALGTLQQLERYGHDVGEKFRTIQAGERSQLHFSTSKGEAHLSLRAVRTVLEMQPVRILILNDIRNELDDKELDSWIKLTRVLTHEIMNSIAPISSISETFLNRDDVKGTSLYDGIEAIYETSTGLINFVDSYRKFSSLQIPAPKPFYLKELLQQIGGLSIVPQHIKLTMLIEPNDLMIYADPNLIRQMFINLIKNAVQSIGDDAGHIYIKAYSAPNDHVFVSVSDDGPAIPEDVADDIFVPFFTTKENGSGIGLSLSRQIMKLSRGNISLLKAGTNGWNTTFILEFE